MSWIAVGIGGATVVGNYLGGQEQAKGMRDASGISERMYNVSRGDLAPYRTFGQNQLNAFSDYLASGESALDDPTMAEVMAQPGYDMRLGAIENSAAARGSLFSGNALRDIGEFGASEYDRVRARRQDELNNRLNLVNVGQSAAAGSASQATNYGNTAANLAIQGSQNRANTWNNMATGIGGAAGIYQGNQMYNNFLNRAYPQSPVPGDAYMPGYIRR